ncbi:MAG: SDR family oxidoreductase [Anaerolineae bacterium]|nr:SDR family oxidoreductase [Anaerolineae bacterium]
MEWRIIGAVQDLAGEDDTITTHRPRALVTGASSGIGAEYARQLAQRGYDLVLVARREDRLRALAGELTTTYGSTAEVIVADLVQEADVARVVAHIEADEQLILLVNNAGVGALGRFAEADLPRLLDMMTLHLQTTVRLTRAALPGLIARGTGAVIMVSSLNSLMPLPYTAVYAATKAFLNHFVEVLSLELAGTGVAVQSVCPNLTRTEIVDTPEFQASGFAAANTPGWMWMGADQVVAESLDRLGKGRAVMVPGWSNRVGVALAGLRHLPGLHQAARRLTVALTGRLLREP